MCLYLHIKLEVSSIILTSFRQGVILPPKKQTPKMHTYNWVKSLVCFDIEHKNQITYHILVAQLGLLEKT